MIKGDISAAAASSCCDGFDAIVFTDKYIGAQVRHFQAAALTASIMCPHQFAIGRIKCGLCTVYSGIVRSVHIVITSYGVEDFTVAGTKIEVPVASFPLWVIKLMFVVYECEMLGIAYGREDIVCSLLSEIAIQSGDGKRGKNAQYYNHKDKFYHGECFFAHLSHPLYLLNRTAVYRVRHGSIVKVFVVYVSIDDDRERCVDINSSSVKFSGARAHVYLDRLPYVGNMGTDSIPSIVRITYLCFDGLHTVCACVSVMCGDGHNGILRVAFGIEDRLLMLVLYGSGFDDLAAEIHNKGTHCRHNDHDKDRCDHRKTASHCLYMH